MKKKEFLVINLALLICLVGVTSAIESTCAGSGIPQEKQAASPLENIKIFLYPPDGDCSYLPHLVAQEKGYFNEAGCKLLILPRLDDAIGSGAGDLYVLGRSVVYANEADRPGLLKAFIVNLQDETRWNDAILVRKSLNINSLGQLEKNQTIGILNGHPAAFPLMKIILKKKGLNPEDFKLTRCDYYDMLGSMPQGQSEILHRSSTINIVYAREPFVSLLLARGDWKLLIDEPLFAKYIFSPWPMSMILFSTRFLKEQPALAQKVISIYDKAILFIREHPDEAQSILSKYVEKKYGVKGLKIRLLNYLNSGEINRDLIQKQSDWYYEHKISSRKINAENVIYTRELRK